MSLSRTIDLVDQDIGNHNQRVSYIAARLAQTMGLDQMEISKIAIAGALHDIGVLKESQYKELADFQYGGGVDYHSILGFRLMDSCRLTKELAPLVQYHHVKHGEVARAKIDHVLLGSEIIFVADRISVILDYGSDLLSQKADVIAKLQEYAGEYFHPDVVTAFLELSEEEAFWYDLQFQTMEKKLQQFNFYNTALTLEEIHDAAKLFTRIIDFRSRFTATHSTAVAMVARAVGELLNFSKRECLMLDIAGHLHDIGKLAIPLLILEKPDKLTIEEWRIMKRHTYFTYQILDILKGVTFEVINEWASFHHERLDGKGYPFKMKGEHLTIGSRIIAVADVFTALAEKRPYRDSLSADMIVKGLQNAKGEFLDSNIVDLVVKNFDYLKNIRDQACCNALVGFEDYFASNQVA